MKMGLRGGYLKLYAQERILLHVSAKIKVVNPAPSRQQITHYHQRYAQNKTYDGEIGNEGGSPKESEQIFQGMGLLWYDTKDCDQNGASSDKDGAKYHPWGEDITKEEAGKKCVPQQGYSAQRGKYDDGERCNLNK